ncbi:E3 ubiquitin-protein ligase TRIM39-like isoform X1 [Chelmon rostratus]|uniref:E3 ubiquitin-protein ligase TRIM39-like isoform X1 n=1 Tax=Chelmon rostratus TaxID=109905 RepID=UPI001BECC8E2|nr:E3 ubiquitin-protein ligase TRIM39-like isoform X1 [Chelmon rostratus]
MSAASCLLIEEQLLCGICLDVFTDPVTLPCGHNFCKTCIMQHWDSSIQCQCPSCKEPFYKRLDLRVNSFISEMAAQFRQSAGRSSSRPAKPGEVPCDICTETKMKALRSCLVCLASYCEAHLKPHLTASRLKRHQLTDPVENLDGRMCKMHDKPLELFCKNDQTCVCMLCPVLDHKSHEVIPLKEEFERKKANLGKRESEIHRLIQERRVKIQDIKHSLKFSKDAADREMAAGVQVFSALIQFLERAQAELIGMIEETQKTTEKQAKGFIQELEQEISELVRRRAEVEQLSRSKDHLHFLQSLGSLSASALTKDWTDVSVNLPSYEGIVRTALDQLEETLGKDTQKLLRKAELHRLKEFAVDVTLDPDTAHPALVLSDDGKQVHHGVVKKNLSENPERFNPSCCVLSKQCFANGRFYFEAQVKEKTRWTLGVAKGSIKRKGIIPLCPENGHWTVWLKNGDEYAALVGSPLPLSPNPKPQKVGVFVDYDEGLVSFYDVDAAALLYSFTGCSFTEKLYPFFSPGLNNDGKNSAPLVISIVNHTDFF